MLEIFTMIGAVTTFFVMVYELINFFGFGDKIDKITQKNKVITYIVVNILALVFQIYVRINLLYLLISILISICVIVIIIFILKRKHIHRWWTIRKKVKLLLGRESR